MVDFLLFIQKTLEKHDCVYAAGIKAKPYLYCLLVPPSQVGVRNVANTVLTVFHSSETDIFLGIGPVEMNIPLGARYAGL